jgi:predicted DNA-binding transcriptional regulator AlpA
VSFAQERLASWESKLSSLSLQRTELEGRLAAIDKALREGQTRQELAATLQRLRNGGSDKALTQPSFEEQLLPLLQQEETLLMKPVLISERQVLQMVQIGRDALNRWIREKQFPPPLLLGCGRKRTKRWSLATVEKFLEQCESESIHA